MWDLPRPGTELVSLAFQGRFLTTRLPRKPYLDVKKKFFNVLPSHLDSPPSFPCLPGKLFLIFQDPAAASPSLEVPWLFQGKLISLSPLLLQQFDFNSENIYHIVLWHTCYVLMGLSPSGNHELKGRCPDMVDAEYISKWAVAVSSYLLITYYVPSTVVHDFTCAYFAHTPHHYSFSVDGNTCIL